MKKNRLENALNVNGMKKKTYTPTYKKHIHTQQRREKQLVYVCKHFKTGTTSSVYKRLNRNQLQIKNTHTVYRLTTAIRSMKTRRKWAAVAQTAEGYESRKKCSSQIYIYICIKAAEEKAKIESALYSRIPLETQSESSAVENTYKEEKNGERKNGNDGKHRKKDETTATIIQHSISVCSQNERTCRTIWISETSIRICVATRPLLDSRSAYTFCCRGWFFFPLSLFLSAVDFFLLLAMMILNILFWSFRARKSCIEHKHTNKMLQHTAIENMQ